MKAADEHALLEEAMLWRYRNRPKPGRGPVFYDCWGACLHICKALGAPVPRDPFTSSACQSGIADIFLGEVKDFEWEYWQDPDYPPSGYIAFFSIGGRVQHSGVTIAGRVYDISRRLGPRVSRFDDRALRTVRYARWAA